MDLNRHQRRAVSTDTTTNTCVRNKQKSRDFRTVTPLHYYGTIIQERPITLSPQSSVKPVNTETFRILLKVTVIGGKISRSEVIHLHTYPYMWIRARIPVYTGIWLCSKLNKYLGTYTCFETEKSQYRRI